jgi:hypothetical protein
VENVAPVVEVLDVSTDVAEEGFPDHLVLGWTVASDAAYYRIEQYVGAAWVAVATVAASTDPWQSYATVALADETSHQFRVIPIDAAGNDGTATAFTKLLVRYPEIPDVDFAYDGAVAGTVTITAAA